MLKGIDISNWQSGLIPSTLDIDFCIAKATEGIGYTDTCCDSFVQDCINNDILWGFYHFARENNPVDEADYFVQETANYFNNGIPVLDYETTNDDNVEWCEQWLVRVHELTGVWPMIYLSASRIPEYENSWIPLTCGLWIAGYPYAATSWDNEEMPYDIGSWEFAAIWQFTSSLNLNGYTVDGNYAYMDVDAWGKYANKTCEPITPVPAEPEKSIDDLAVETILGEYGTGADREKMLGSNYQAVQNRVNEYYSIADEVIQGIWGNGWNRENALNGAGYNASIVQRIVNQKLNYN